MGYVILLDRSQYWFNLTFNKGLDQMTKSSFNLNYSSNPKSLKSSRTNFSIVPHTEQQHIVHKNPSCYTTSYSVSDNFLQNPQSRVRWDIFFKQKKFNIAQRKRRLMSGLQRFGSSRAQRKFSGHSSKLGPSKFQKKPSTTPHLASPTTALRNVLNQKEKVWLVRCSSVVST